MADEQQKNDSGLMAEFEEFLAAKQAQQKETDDAEDFDVEIWDENGRGVRTKRSHARPFLQTLGIDLDEEEKKDEGDGKKTPAKRTATPPKAESITKKYFSNKKS